MGIFRKVKRVVKTVSSVVPTPDRGWHGMLHKYHIVDMLNITGAPYEPMNDLKATLMYYYLEGALAGVSAFKEDINEFKKYVDNMAAADLSDPENEFLARVCVSSNISLLLAYITGKVRQWDDKMEKYQKKGLSKEQAYILTSDWLFKEKKILKRTRIPQDAKPLTEKLSKEELKRLNEPYYRMLAERVEKGNLEDLLEDWHLVPENLVARALTREYRRELQKDIEEHLERAGYLPVARKVA
ncbi:MAG: hypothetical protein J7L59_02150 [Nanoarchaeota archaeon]|nr:hypothetical protein [Nanoarchaeota archaeon]